MKALPYLVGQKTRAGLQPFRPVSLPKSLSKTKPWGQKNCLQDLAWGTDQRKATLTVPRSTLASIILEWKNYQESSEDTLPRTY